MLAPVLVEAPAAPVVEVDEAKAHLRVDTSDEDGLITALVAAATAHLDGWSGILGRALATQRWRQDFCGFSDCMRLPLAPVAADGIVSITYFDAEDVQQTLATSLYRVLTDSLGPYVTCKPDQSWPACYGREDAVSITFAAGYGAPAAVPQAIKQAMLLMIGHWYANREAVNVGNITTELPIGTAALLRNYRRVVF